LGNSDYDFKMSNLSPCPQTNKRLKHHAARFSEWPLIRGKPVSIVVIRVNDFYPCEIAAENLAGVRKLFVGAVCFLVLY